MTRRRGVVTAVLSIAALGATVFVVWSRHELQTTRQDLRDAQHILTRLDAQLRGDTEQRISATAALAAAQAVMQHDTEARDALRGTGRVEYGKLTSALATLVRHRAEVTANSARAERLDRCLLGASQVLNEAAVGDTAHLATTLPVAQRLCTEAAA
jgi:hypothetical protein